MMRLAGRLALLWLLAAGDATARETQAPPPSLKCPGDRVVWVNTRSGVYHVQGDIWFGRTANGKFVCEKAAVAEGDKLSRSHIGLPRALTE